MGIMYLYYQREVVVVSKSAKQYFLDIKAKLVSMIAKIDEIRDE